MAGIIHEIRNPSSCCSADDQQMISPLLQKKDEVTASTPLLLHVATGTSGTSSTITGTTSSTMNCSTDSTSTSSSRSDINGSNPGGLHHDNNTTLTNNNSNNNTTTSSLMLLFSWTSVLLLLLLLFCVPAIGGFLFGYDISATSFALVQQQDSSTIVSNSVTIQGMIVSATSAGAFQGSFFIYYYNIPNNIGRRTELRYSALLYTIGAFCETFSGTALWPKNISTSSTSSSSSSVGMEVLALIVLLIGRVIYGYGIALAMHGGPTYLAEMIPASVRGLFVSLKEASIVFGILMGYIIGYKLLAVSNKNNNSIGWEYTYACIILISIPMYGMSFVIPESSRWLLMKGRKVEALDSLRFIYSHEDSQRELDQMVLNQQSQTTGTSSNSNNHHDDELDNLGNSNETEELLSASTSSTTTTTNNPKSLELLSNPSYRAPLIAGVGLVILQQITGQPSVLSYATPILRTAGLADSSSIYLAICKLVATLVAAISVESFGRKKLLYIGNTLMLLSLLVLAFNGSFDNSNDDDDDSTAIATNTTSSPRSRLLLLISSSSTSSSLQEQPQQHEVYNTVLIALFVYICGYQISFGPISWLLISEVFPLQVRGQAVAFAVQINFLFNAIVQFVVPIVQNAIGYNITFGTFAAFTGFSLYFVKVYVPETNGLTLEQIEDQFKRLYYSTISSSNDETDRPRPPLRYNTPDEHMIRQCDV